MGHPTPPPGDRPAPLGDDELSVLLRDAVSAVQPAPALDQLRSRTAARPLVRRPWVLALGAAAATAATITAVTLVQGDPTSSSAPVAPAAGSSPDWTMGWSEGAEPRQGNPPPALTDSPAPSSGAGEEGQGTGVAQGELQLHEELVPVYYVGDTPDGARLYREFHKVAVGGQDARAGVGPALAEALTGDPLDPDYRVPWPAGTTLGPGRIGEGTAMTVAVDLVAPDGVDLTQRQPGLSDVDAELAIQQLVFTAQGAAQARIPLRFTVGGRTVRQLLGVEVAREVTAADVLEVQAPVQVTTPQEGDEVGSTFTVEGRAALFEGTYHWELVQDGTVIEKGDGTATECCTQSPYRFRVPSVAPGDYLLRVYDPAVSAEDGAAPEDTKQITVR